MHSLICSCMILSVVYIVVVIPMKARALFWMLISVPISDLAKLSINVLISIPIDIPISFVISVPIIVPTIVPIIVPVSFHSSIPGNTQNSLQHNVWNSTNHRIIYTAMDCVMNYARKKADIAPSIELGIKLGIAMGKHPT